MSSITTSATYHIAPTMVWTATPNMSYTHLPWALYTVQAFTLPFSPLLFFSTHSTLSTSVAFHMTWQNLFPFRFGFCMFDSLTIECILVVIMWTPDLIYRFFSSAQHEVEWEKKRREKTKTEQYHRDATMNTCILGRAANSCARSYLFDKYLHNWYARVSVCDIRPSLSAVRCSRCSFISIHCHSIWCGEDTDKEKTLAKSTIRRKANEKSIKRKTLFFSFGFSRRVVIRRNKSKSSLCLQFVSGFFLLVCEFAICVLLRIWMAFLFWLAYRNR